MRAMRSGTWHSAGSTGIHRFLVGLLVRGRALAPVVDLCSLDALAIRSLNKEHTQAPTRIPDKLQVLASTRLPWSDVVLSRKIAPAASACVPHSASTSPHDARKRRLTGRVQLSRVAQRLLGIRVRSYPCSRLVGGRSSWRARLAPSEHQLFQSSSASRVTAGAAGFFTFQQSVRPERYGDPSRFDRRAGNRSPGALTCGRASPPRYPPVWLCAIQQPLPLHEPSAFSASADNYQRQTHTPRTQPQ
jgi:hypothetical protein